MTSGAWALALVRRLEISGGCCVVDGEDQVALAPAVLSYKAYYGAPSRRQPAVRPVVSGGRRCTLCSRLSVGGYGGDGAAGAYALCAAPVWGDVFRDEGPAGSQRSFRPLGFLFRLFRS